MRECCTCVVLLSVIQAAYVHFLLKKIATVLVAMPYRCCPLRISLRMPTSSGVAVSNNSLHVFSSCSQTNLKGVLQWLHLADRVAAQWLRVYSVVNVWRSALKNSFWCIQEVERASKKVQTQSSVVDNVRKQLATLEDTLLHTKKQYKQHEESIEPLRQKVSAAEVRLERLSVERHSLLVYTMVLYTCSVAFLYPSSICSFSVKKLLQYW